MAPPWAAVSPGQPRLPRRGLQWAVGWPPRLPARVHVPGLVQDDTLVFVMGTTSVRGDRSNRTFKRVSSDTGGNSGDLSGVFGIFVVLRVPSSIFLFTRLCSWGHPLSLPPWTRGHLSLHFGGCLESKTGPFPSPGLEDTQDLCVDPCRGQGCSDGIGHSRGLSLQTGDAWLHASPGREM